MCKIIEPSKIQYTRFHINVAKKLFLFDFGQVFVVQIMKSAVDLAHGWFLSYLKNKIEMIIEWLLSTWLMPFCLKGGEKCIFRPQDNLSSNSFYYL